MKQSVLNSFTPGISKRNEKIEDHYIEKCRVYSYKDKENLLDVARDFSKWVKENCNEIKKMNHITPELVNRYLESKRTSCTSHTIKQYASRIDKIGKLGESMFNCKMNMKASHIPSGKEAMRTIAMKESDYQKIVDIISNAKGFIAVKLSHAFGLRVSETVKVRPCDIKNDKLVIYKSKGGKTRILPIESKEQRDIINKLKEIADKERCKKDSPILNIKQGSVNKWLNSRCKQLGISRYNDHKSSIHSIRKNWAIREYNKELMHHNQKTAWANVSEKLGHGRDREDLREVYLPKQ